MKDRDAHGEGLALGEGVPVLQPEAERDCVTDTVPERDARLGEDHAEGVALLLCVPLPVMDTVAQALALKQPVAVGDTDAVLLRDMTEGVEQAE